LLALYYTRLGTRGLWTRGLDAPHKQFDAHAPRHKHIQAVVGLEVDESKARMAPKVVPV
jgi:hypothetical protein